MSRRRPRWAWAVAAVVLVAAAVGAAWYFRAWEALAPRPAEAAEPVTAAVEMATLTTQVRLSGQLSYGEAAPLPAAAGTITVLPAAGETVLVGERVYEADGAPVVLFRGSRPFWRELSVGSSDGKDVRQLQSNLAALGFLDAKPTGRYGSLTRQAVHDWQKSIGVPRTGVFSPSSVVVADAPGIRIERTTARLGEVDASPATYTSTTLRATAKLTAAQARTLAVGTPIAVTLPDGASIDAELAAVDPGGLPTGDGDAVTPPTATVEFEDQAQVADAGAVAVRIVIRDDEEQPETLVVPATALLATPDGGYAVEVWDGASATRTPVTIGLVADARAQVLASGADAGGDGRVLAPGDLVVLAR